MSGPGLQAVRVVGGLVPPGLFGRIQADEVRDSDSLSPRSYHLPGRETVRDAANRSWTYLRGAWRDWRDHTTAQPPGSPGTGPARERWLLVLLRELGYGQLPALRGGLDVDGVEYPVSHAWQHVPVHLLGPGVELDRRNPGVAGAARAPQAMVQELLNRTEKHLWAVLSNGLRLRLLRDSTALAGSAYVEFDLEAIFDGELFAEFLLLWQTCHVSRLEKRGGTGAPAADCWLEAWRDEAVDSGTRALNQLRDGVQRALTALGSGFLRHRDNGWLVEALRTGELSTEAYHRALLRLAYRLLFLSVAEDRGVLLHQPSPEAADRYARYFSVGRLRRLSRRSGGPHGDLWEAQRIVFGALGGDGLPALGLPALAGLFDPDDEPLDSSGGQVDHLLGCSLANTDLLAAMRALGWISGRGERVQPVDYRNLGAEELGSVYESLLELVPRLDIEERSFSLEQVAGNERKTTGSYYTPSSLVSALLDSALDPLLDDAVKNAADADDAVTRLLRLTVCDPACGSGHFLVAAARRIARRVAQLRSGDEEPTPSEVQHALREVVGHCVYGVDANPLAAELAKVSLWMEALEPGKPLGFLDARIRVGNSLLGTTPALLAGEVPDEAFKELEGDDKKVAAATRKRNKAERGGQYRLDEVEPVLPNTELAKHREPLLALADRAATVREQADAWQQYQRCDEQLARQRAQADAWCAAFAWKLVPGAPPAPTSATVRGFVTAPDEVDSGVRAEVARLAGEYRFLHWHLEFPEIFAVSGADDPDAGPEGWTGGFSCLLGNPPWDQVQLDAREFFATRDPEVANAPTMTARNRMIAGLADTDPLLHAQFMSAQRKNDALKHFVHASQRFPRTAFGRLNTYSLFAETFRHLTEPTGRSGVIVPTGIATDSFNQYFFRDLVETATLAALYDFENRGGFFEAVDSRTKFSLLTLAGRDAPEPAAHFACFLHDPALIETASFSLTPDEIALLNPNTKTCPIFRTRRDAEITLDIYRRVPVLVKEGDPDGNPWGVSFQLMFMMNTDSHRFRTRMELEADGWYLEGNVFIYGKKRMLPLYEAKMLHHYDHRWATYEGTDVRDVTLEEKQDPNFVVLPRYWIPETDVDDRLDGRWDQDWLLGWRDICRSTDERTLIVTPFPRSGVGNKIPLMLGPSSRRLLLAASLSSFACDFAARQKIGGTTMNYYLLMQLPVLAPETYDLGASWDREARLDEWLSIRVFELICTAQDMVVSGFGLAHGPSAFPWDADRRRILRAELDAAFFHLYDIDREDVDYVLETFPIVRRRDEEEYGEYRTKRLILEVYGRMAEAIATGEPYQTIVNPPPGKGSRHASPPGGLS